MISMFFPSLRFCTWGWRCSEEHVQMLSVQKGVDEACRTACCQKPCKTSAPNTEFHNHSSRMCYKCFLVLCVQCAKIAKSSPGTWGVVCPLNSLSLSLTDCWQTPTQEQLASTPCRVLRLSNKPKQTFLTREGVAYTSTYIHIT